MSLYHTIRRIVQEELAQARGAELAVVQEQHPHASEGDSDNYACTVRLRDSGIVLRRVPVATQQIGWASIPSVDDLVLVGFLGGDVNAPVILGRLYNEQDRPPPNEDGRAVLHLPLAAGEEQALHLELDTTAAPAARLTVGRGLELTLQDDDPVVSIRVEAGGAAIEVARDGTISIKSQGDLELEGTQLQVKGASVSIEAQGELKLKGAVVNIN